MRVRGDPLFIVFEGIDGCGKTSQIARLADYIRSKDKYQDILLTREPTWRTSELREKLQGDGDAFSDGERMAYLFVQDRKAHGEEQIVPALNQRAFVLCDRYALSTCAYQAAQGVPLDTLLDLHEEAKTRAPDVTFFVDVPREVAEVRMVRRGEVQEKFEKNVAFVDALVAQYRNLVEQNLADQRLQKIIGPIVSIDGTGTSEYVAARICEAYESLVSSLLNER